MKMNSILLYPDKKGKIFPQSWEDCRNLGELSNSVKNKDENLRLLAEQ